MIIIIIIIIIILITIIEIIFIRRSRAFMDTPYCRGTYDDTIVAWTNVLKSHKKQRNTTILPSVGQRALVYPDVDRETTWKKYPLRRPRRTMDV